MRSRVWQGPGPELHRPCTEPRDARAGLFLDGVQRCECGIGGGVDKDAIIAEAQQRGITLTEADFVADTSVELSEDELDEVAGGGKCAGVMGGGTRGGGCDLCSCMAGGCSAFYDGKCDAGAS